MQLVGGDLGLHPIGEGEHEGRAARVRFLAGGEVAHRVAPALEVLGLASRGPDSLHVVEIPEAPLDLAVPGELEHLDRGAVEGEVIEGSRSGR